MSAFNESYPDESAQIQHRWALLGIIAGLIACISYPVATLIPLPTPRLTLIVGASFGPALSIACWALGHVLQRGRRSVAAEMGAVLNALAGALVTGMILVQLAVRQSTVAPGDPVLEDFFLVRIWNIMLGLDVAFDLFIGLGTALFGIAMFSDRRFGKLVGGMGIVIGVIFILGFNIATFPVPPAETGLLDPGMLTGLWYLLVVILLIRAVLAEKRTRNTNLD